LPGPVLASTAMADGLQAESPIHPPLPGPQPGRREEEEGGASPGAQRARPPPAPNQVAQVPSWTPPATSSPPHLLPRPREQGGLGGAKLPPCCRPEP
jgi:hypothetical protein